MDQFVSRFSYGFALALTLASLAMYLSQAFLSRMMRGPAKGGRLDFTLGLPESTYKEKVFASSLVAAGTSLSTVLVFFLTAGALYGWWLFLCPLMFALGNWVMYRVYLGAEKRGSLREETGGVGAAGLIPFISQQVAGSRRIGLAVALLSVLNLLSVLVLELLVGVEIFSYLTGNTFGAMAGAWLNFLMFAVAVALLLAYVMVGGFRAVLASDLWQFRAIKWAVLFAVAGVLYFGLSQGVLYKGLGNIVKEPPVFLLWAFLVNVVLANLFSPLSQESSWQRFRAFRDAKNFSLAKGIWRSIRNALFLWAGLIVLSFGLQMTVSPAMAKQLSSLANVLEALHSLNDSYFPFFIFPIISLAAVSALFSTADTCIAALLFLLDYLRSHQTGRAEEKTVWGLPRDYFLAVLGIFAFALLAYAFVRLWFDPTILQLIFSVFSNLVVLAPTVLSAALLGPAPPGRRRAGYFAVSLLVGFLLYWASALAAMVGGKDYLWLSQLSIALGLVGSVIPLLPLWFAGKTPVNSTNS